MSTSTRLRLAYDVSLVPEDGWVVTRRLTALAKSYDKDAAGAAFHHLALRQLGLISNGHISKLDSMDTIGDSEDSEDETCEDSNSGESFEENGASTEDTQMHELPPGWVQSGTLCLNSCRTRWKKVRKPKNEVVKPSEKDYYKLLGLEQERWLATEDQILKGSI